MRINEGGRWFVLVVEGRLFYLALHFGGWLRIIAGEKANAGFRGVTWNLFERTYKHV